MPNLEYVNELLPAPDEFRRQLREAGERYDPVDELLSLERDLSEFERRHNLSSAELYSLFTAGKAGDLPEIIEWVGIYEAFLGLKTAISESLKIVVNEPIPSQID